MAGGVFISYRREDSDGFAGRIYDRLAMRLGHDNVFFDVDAIPPGRDFVDVLSDRVGKCDALIAVIGKNWITTGDSAKRRRLDDPNDFVRIEIEAALSREVPVIPVLVDGAPMPHAEDLPDGLKKLARRQAIEISHSRFDSDAERLTEALAEIEGKAKEPSAGVAAAPPASGAPSSASDAPRASRARLLVPLAVAAIAVAGGAAFILERAGQQRKETAVRATSDAAISTEPSAPANAAAAPSAPSKSLNAAAAAPEKSLKAETGDWLSADDFRDELKKQNEAGLYPDSGSARCDGGVVKTRAHWAERPWGMKWAFWRLSDDAFASKNSDLARQGFTLQYDNTFKDCDGHNRHVALWTKSG